MSVAGDGDALAAFPAAVFFSVAGIKQIQLIINYTAASGIYAALIAGLVRQQSASLKIPVKQIFGCEQSPFFITVIFGKTIPLKEYVISAVKISESVWIIHQTPWGFQMILLFF